MTSNIVREVFARAVPNGRFENYSLPCAKAAIWPTHLQLPQAPGHMLYRAPDDLPESSGFGFNAMRVMGAAPDFPRAIPIDIPQFVIHTAGNVFKDGLNLLFPAKAVNAYIDEQLQSPAFEDIREGQKYKMQLISNLPRIAPAMDTPLLPETRFRRSMERDFVEDALGPINGTERVKSDHTMLSKSDLALTYQYSKDRPELWSGLYLWQTMIRQYANEMFWLTIKSNIMDSSSPQGRLISFTEDAVGNNASFPVFLLPHIVGQAQQHGRLTETGALDTIDINEGITLANRNGIFRRRFSSQFGERMTTCPFSQRGLDLLVRNISTDDDATRSNLFRCYEKIVTTRKSNHGVQAVCTAVQEALDVVMQESTFSLPSGYINSGVTAKSGRPANTHLYLHCPHFTAATPR